MSIETEHHGFKITYAENEDRWRCWELDCEGKSLSAVKTKIAAALAATRKIDATPVFVIKSWGSASRATVTSWAGPKAVWVMGDRRRTKENAKDIALITPESEAAMAAAHQLDQQAKALREQADEIRKALPRISPPEGARFEADDEV